MIPGGSVDSLGRQGLTYVELGEKEIISITCHFAFCIKNEERWVELTVQASAEEQRHFLQSKPRSSRISRVSRVLVLSDPTAAGVAMAIPVRREMMTKVNFILTDVGGASALW